MSIHSKFKIRCEVVNSTAAFKHSTSGKEILILKLNQEIVRMESRHRHCHRHPDLHPRAATESSSCCCCCVWSSSNFPLIIAFFYWPIFELKSHTFSLFKWPQQDEGDFVWSVGHHSFLVPLLPITSFSESAKKFIHTHN